jgi:hypothetical protein
LKENETIPFYRRFFDRINKLEKGLAILSGRERIAKTPALVMGRKTQGEIPVHWNANNIERNSDGRHSFNPTGFIDFGRLQRALRHCDLEAFF